MGKVGAGARRVAVWALMTGTAVGAVSALSGCMEVGPAAAPVGADGATVGPGGDVGTSQDGAGGRHAGVRHYAGAGLDVGASPSVGESAARPSSGPSVVAPVPIAVTPPAGTPTAAGPTTPSAQPSTEPTQRPTPSPTAVASPPPSPSPSSVAPSGSPSAG